MYEQEIKSSQKQGQERDEQNLGLGGAAQPEIDIKVIPKSKTVENKVLVCFLVNKVCFKELFPRVLKPDGKV